MPVRARLRALIGRVALMPGFFEAASRSQRSDLNGAYRWRQHPRQQAYGDRADLYLSASVARRARKICAAAGVAGSAQGSGSLTEEQMEALRGEVGEVHGRGRPAREVNMSIKRLMDLGCYRGLRHRRGLPVRGQRTKTNARTRKGPRASHESAQVDRTADIAQADIDTWQSLQHAKVERRRRSASRRRHRAHPRDLQQHDRHDHRSPGQHPVLGDLGWRGFPRLAQEHAVCRPGRRGTCRRMRRRNTA